VKKFDVSEISGWPMRKVVECLNEHEDRIAALEQKLATHVHAQLGDAIEPTKELKWPNAPVPEGVCPICHRWRDRFGRCACRGNNIGYDGRGQWHPEPEEERFECRVCGAWMQKQEDIGGIWWTCPVCQLTTGIRPSILEALADVRKLCRQEET
jgi:hypothetical protein